MNTLKWELILILNSWTHKWWPFGMYGRSQQGGHENFQAARNPLASHGHVGQILKKVKYLLNCQKRTQNVRWGWKSFCAACFKNLKFPCEIIILLSTFISIRENCNTHTHTLCQKKRLCGLFPWPSSYDPSLKGSPWSLFWGPPGVFWLRPFE